MSASYETKPWYTKKKKKKITLLSKSLENNTIFSNLISFIHAALNAFKLCKFSFFSLAFGIFGTILFLNGIHSSESLFFSFSITLGSLIFFFFSVYLLVIQIGAVSRFFMEDTKRLTNYQIGYLYLKSKLEKTKPRTNMMASELVLKQFVQQVRLYGLEKNYFIQKRTIANIDSDLIHNEKTTLLDRRWCDVQDTLDEFDIYLSPNSQGRIENLLGQFSPQTQDVSKIFQDIAESFESTWRAKGINIEHAIVVPLEAYTHDKLLKRLLAGPWRTSVYFAPKGGTVTFSAKKHNGKIVARWQCVGTTFSQDFYDTIKNRNMTVNSRIETGMVYISNQPQNSNILLGLISLIIWNDLATTANINFNIEQGDDGMIICIKL